MAQDLYKVILTGNALPGADLSETKQRFAAIFKLPADTVERYFQGKPVIIKNKVDFATAEKYRIAIEKAGGECLVASMEDATPQPKDSGQPSGDTQSGTVQENASGDQPETASPERILFDLSPKPASLQYSPLECRAITAAEEGLNFNRFSCEAIPYAEILSVTAYSVPSGAKLKPRLMIFIAKQKKPLVADAATIRYDDFPGTRGDDTESSLRGFIAYLLKSHGLRMDRGTGSFLDGAQLVVHKKDEALLAASVGTVLDAESLFVLHALKGTLSAKASASSSAEAAPETGPRQAPAEEVPGYSDEELFRMFIGPNAERYLPLLSRFRDGAFQAGWHWPAFLAPVFWHFYRKIYPIGIALLVVSLLIMLCVFIHPALLLLMIFVHLASGLTADYFYARQALSSLGLIRKNLLIEDKASAVAKEGGVNPVAVYITSASFAVLLLIGAAVFVFQFVLQKSVEITSQKAMEMPMPPLPPGTALPPGISMPQNAGEAMQLAYNNMSMAELRRACTAAQIYFAEESDSRGPLTLDVLKQRGFTAPPEIDFRIINGTPQGLRMSARHAQGSKELLIDHDCRFVTAP